MSVAGHVARGRARHAQLMTDACTVTRIVPGSRAFNETTKGYTEATTTVYTGPCRIKIWRGNEEQAGDVEVNVQRYYFDLPLTGAVPNVQRRDEVTVTASLNPALVGRVLVLTDVETESTDTALRVTCEYAQ